MPSVQELIARRNAISTRAPSPVGGLGLGFTPQELPPFGTAGNPGVAQPLPGVIEPDLADILTSPIGSLIRSPLAYDLARKIRTPGSFPGQSLANFGFGQSASLVEKELTGQEVTPLDRVLAGTEILPPGADDAIVKSMIGIGAIKGGKARLPFLFHGAKDIETDVTALAELGFLTGRSSELKASGTSTSPDPMVSFRMFTPYQLSPEVRASYMVKVKPGFTEGKDFFEKGRRNLSPFEYFTGAQKSLESNEQLIFKGQPYSEHELFLTRQFLGFNEGDAVDEVFRLRRVRLKLEEEFGALEAAGATRESGPRLGELEVEIGRVRAEIDDALKEFERPEVRIEPFSERDQRKFLEFERGYSKAEGTIQRFLTSPLTATARLGNMRTEVPAAIETLRSSRAYFARNMDDLASRLREAGPAQGGIQFAQRVGALSRDADLAWLAQSRVGGAGLGLTELNDSISAVSKDVMRDAARGRLRLDDLRSHAEIFRARAAHARDRGQPLSTVDAFEDMATALDQSYRRVSLEGPVTPGAPLRVVDIEPEVKVPFNRLYKERHKARERFAEAISDIARSVPVRRDVVTQPRSGLFDSIGTDLHNLKSVTTKKHGGSHARIEALEDAAAAGDEMAPQVARSIFQESLKGSSQDVAFDPGLVETMWMRKSILQEQLEHYIDRHHHPERIFIWTTVFPSDLERGLRRVGKKDVTSYGFPIGDTRVFTLSKAQALKAKKPGAVLVRAKLNPLDALMRGDSSRQELVMMSDRMTHDAITVIGPGFQSTRRRRLP